MGLGGERDVGVVIEGHHEGILWYLFFLLKYSCFTNYVSFRCTTGDSVLYICVFIYYFSYSFPL